MIHVLLVVVDGENVIICSLVGTHYYYVVCARPGVAQNEMV